MLNNVSWQGYLISLAIITTGYYLCIYLFYFRNDFRLRLNNASRHDNAPPVDLKLQNPKGSDNVQEEDSSASKEALPETEEFIVYACVDELNAYFDSARMTGCVKSELLNSLTNILRKYPTILSSQYKESLSNIILTQAEHICSVHLNAEEVDGLWVG